jgi:hypothetical protein
MGGRIVVDVTDLSAGPTKSRLGVSKVDNIGVTTDARSSTSMTTIATASSSDGVDASISKVIAEVTSDKAPPAEIPQHVSRRRLIITSFWAIVLLLGFPIWYQTTAVYRAALPLQLMTDWAEGRVRFLRLHIQLIR